MSTKPLVVLGTLAFQSNSKQWKFAHFGKHLFSLMKKARAWFRSEDSLSDKKIWRGFAI